MKTNRILISLLAVAVLVGTLAPLPVLAASGSFSVTNVGKGNVNAPTCKVSASRKTLRAGEASTIFWRSKRAEYMTGLFTLEKREAQGRMKVRFSHPGEQEFKLFFVGPGGATSCDLMVNVREKRGR